MSEYNKRFNYVAQEVAIARVILATEIYRDYEDLMARAEKTRKLQHDFDTFSTVADLVRKSRERCDEIFALTGRLSEWEDSHKNPRVLITEAITAIMEAYGGTYSHLLFKIRDVRSLADIRTADLTDQECKILANWHACLYYQ